MHIIDGPFLPHNLISTQESPVPLLKFQMAPRLKIFMASWSKKEPRYTLFVSQKSRQTNPIQVPQWAPMTREARLQGILHVYQKHHLSGSPGKEPSLKVPLMESLAESCPTTRALEHSSIKVPCIRDPPPTYQVPHGRKGAPMERDARIRRLSQQDTVVVCSFGHMYVVSLHNITEEGPVARGDPRWSRVRVLDFDAR